MTEQVAVKPPTQIAGVSGIAAVPVVMNEPPTAPSVDWTRVVNLPVFQMYAAELQRNHGGLDSKRHAEEVVRDKGAGLDLFNAYCDWHKAKGYWPNETPLGKLKPSGGM